MKPLREELEEYKSKVLAAFDEIAQYADDHRERAFVGSIRDAIEDVELPLPRHPEEEPLEKLAERKGAVMTVEFTKRGWAPNMRMTADEARKYLEGLEDKSGVHLGFGV